MPNKINLIIAIFAILLVSPFAYAIDGFNQDPTFVAKDVWSIKYIQMFKQAIKEKYDLSDETLNGNLIVISVVKGTESDGFAIPFATEKYGRIHYVYKVGWALYNDLGIRFDVQDDSGAELSDQQILDNMKTSLTPVFAINSIVSKDQARNSCNPQAEFPDLESPWYSNDNNIRFYGAGTGLVFECHKTVNTEENKCITEVFSLETGEKLNRSEGACLVYSPDGKVPVSGFSSTDIIYSITTILVIAGIVIFLKRRK